MDITNCVLYADSRKSIRALFKNGELFQNSAKRFERLVHWMMRKRNFKKIETGRNDDEHGRDHFVHFFYLGL